jgi:hypothetical protein
MIFQNIHDTICACVVRIDGNQIAAAAHAFGVAVAILFRHEEIAQAGEEAAFMRGCAGGSCCRDFVLLGQDPHIRYANCGILPDGGRGPLGILAR